MSPRRSVTREELDVPLLSYGEAIEAVVDAFEPLEAAPTALVDAGGLVLGEQIVASDDIPSFDNSAMDGYAVRAADVLADGQELSVGAFGPRGRAAKIMTGQPLPDGADAVVPWERVEPAGTDAIRVLEVPVERAFIRPRGEDVRAGRVVLEPESLLAPSAIGMLAALGCSTVSARPRPRVGVLSTGDELVGVDEPIGRGRVRDANAPLICATVVAMGAVVSATERVADDPDAITTALRELVAASDLVVTSGGASVGEKDWLRTVLEREGELRFWKVALRPGKPVALAHVEHTPVIMLPGNPGSVIACSHVFVGRAIRRLAGRDPSPMAVAAELSESVVGDPDRTVVHPVHVVDGLARPAPVRSSQVLSNALGVDGWVIVPPGGAQQGERVAVELAP